MIQSGSNNMIENRGLFKHPELTQPYEELGKKSLRSYESIASKIYSLAKRLKEEPENAFSEDDYRKELRLLDLIEQTAEEMIAEELASSVSKPEDESASEYTSYKEQQDRLSKLRGTRRYVEILRTEIGRRLEGQAQPQPEPEARAQTLPETENFEAQQFEPELLARNEMEFWHILPQFVPGFPASTNLSPDYPRSDERIADEQREEDEFEDQVELDLQAVERLLDALRKYVRINLANQSIPKNVAGKEHIEEILIPKVKEVQSVLEAKRAEFKLEEWKDSLSTNPVIQAYEAIQVAPRATFMEVMTLLSNIEVNRAEIAALAASAQAAGIDHRAVEEHLSNTYLTPLEVLTAQIEAEAFNLWKTEIDGRLQALHDLIALPLPATLADLFTYYENINQEVETVQAWETTEIERLPQSKKADGEEVVNDLIESANTRGQALVDEQWRILDLDHAFPLAGPERSAIADAQAAVNLGANLDDLRTQVRNLEDAIAVFKRAVNGHATDLIPQTKEKMDTDFIEPAIQVPQQVLEVAKEKIEELEGLTSTDIQSEFDRIVTRIFELGTLPIATLNRQELQELNTQLNEIRLKARQIRGLSDQLSGANEQKAEELIKQLIEKRESPANLTNEEIADELLANEVDPFSGVGIGANQRFKDLVTQFSARIDIAARPINHENPEEVQQELDRIVQRLRVGLVTMDVALKSKRSEAATGDRSRLYEVMAEKHISRREVLIGATYHPEWGELVRNTLRKIIEKSTSVPDREVATDPMSYPNLAGETGRGNLLHWLSIQDELRELPSPQGEDDAARARREAENKRRERARDFAFFTFTSFDLLNEILRILQRKTQTPSHNQKSKDIDRRWIVDPAAAAVHSAQRDGGTLSTQRGHIFVFQPITDAYCKNNEKRHELQEAQRLERLRRVALYGPDAEVLFDSIPAMTGIEGLFQGTYEWLLLNEGERLDFLRGIETLSAQDLYEAAESGWAEILNLLTSKIPPNLTKEHILEEAKDDMGLLAKWTKAAGKAKMFAKGETLRLTMVPFLTDYILRLFYGLANESVEYRDDVFKELVEALDRNGKDTSLKDFQFELDLVIRNLMRNKPRLHFIDPENHADRDGDYFIDKANRAPYVQNRLQREEQDALNANRPYTDADRRRDQLRFGQQFDNNATSVKANLRADIEVFLVRLRSNKSAVKGQASKSIYDPYLYNNQNIINFVNEYYKYKGKSIPPGTQRIYKGADPDVNNYYDMIDRKIALPTVFNSGKSDLVEEE